MSKIQLGDRVRDTITPFMGIAVARTEWLHGCTRFVVQPERLHDGKLVEPISFDEPQLKLVKKGVVAVGVPDTGGPAPMPQRHPDPQR